MSWKKGLLAVAAIMLVLGVVVAFNYKAIILYLATNTGQKIEVAANRPVPWQAGPQTSITPLTDRPPNIVMIVIDDMGINNVRRSAPVWRRHRTSMPWPHGARS